jgi:predicted transcriptional regulator
MKSRRYRSDVPYQIVKLLKEKGALWMHEIRRELGIPVPTIVYWTTGVISWKKPGALIIDNVVKAHHEGQNVKLSLKKGAHVNKLLKEVGM